MNAAVRAVVRMGIYVGAKVYFIHEVRLYSDFRHSPRRVCSVRHTTRGTKLELTSLFYRAVIVCDTASRTQDCMLLCFCN